MTLLEAVNLCLRSTGETGVATIASSHPQIATILAELDVVLARLQKRGWWFNTFVLDLSPSTDPADGGKIILDPLITYVKPLRQYLDYYPKGNVLWDRGTNTAVLNQVVQADVRFGYTRAEWDDLPDSFRDYVGTGAALSYASNYDADPLQIQKVSVAHAQAKQAIGIEHTRYAKVNLFQSGSTGRSLNRSYGNRYYPGRL